MCPKCDVEEVKGKPERSGFTIPTTLSMKFTTTLLSLIAVTVSGCFADATSDEVKAAAAKLEAASGYKWTTTTVMPPREGQEGRFRTGPTNGATEKGGYTTLSISRGETTTEAIFKGSIGVLKGEGGWKTAEELAAESSSGGGGGVGGGGGGGGRGGRGRMGGRVLESFKLPSVSAAEVAGKMEGLKKDGDAITGDLTGDFLKEQFSFGRGPRGGGGGGGEGPPLPEGAKGNVKFWIKDGTLTKYEIHVEGTMKFNGNEFKLDRTTTTEFKEVGSTKVEPAADAKSKLDSAKPAETKPAEAKPAETKPAETKPAETKPEEKKA